MPERKKPSDEKSAAVPQIHWDDSEMRSSYANVCNVTGTREELVLLFGTNTAWKGGEERVSVKLGERLILSPFAAKRLHLLLGNVLQQHEKRFGQLDMGGPVPQTTELSS